MADNVLSEPRRAATVRGNSLLEVRPTAGHGINRLVGRTSSVLSALGAALILLSLMGAVALEVDPDLPALPASGGAPPRHASRASNVPATAAAPTTSRPITRLVIGSIGLDTPVLPAPLAEHDGATTWDVPPKVAGHAEGTPGAGEPGNAILIGHLTSIHLGDVFLHLQDVRPGDLVVAYSGDQPFDYRVSASGDVDRNDLSVLGPTVMPSLTMITCSGLWLPTVWDYAERRVVRAEITSAPRAAAGQI